MNASPSEGRRRAFHRTVESFARASREVPHLSNSLAEVQTTFIRIIENLLLNSHHLKRSVSAPWRGDGFDVREKTLSRSRNPWPRW